MSYNQESRSNRINSFKRTQAGIVVLFLILTCQAGLCNEDSALLLSRGKKFLADSRYRSCKESLDACVKSAGIEHDNRTLAEAYLWRSRYYLELMRYDNALEDARNTLKLFGELGNADGAFASRLLVITFYYEKDRRIDAWREMDELEKAPRSGLSKETLIDFYLLRGRMLVGRENYDLAWKNYTEALNESEATGDQGRSILTKLQMAQFYSKKKDLSKARDLCLSALEEARRLNRSYLVGQSLMRDGIIKLEESRRPESLTSFIGALEIFAKIENWGAVGILYISIAGVYSDMSNWEKCEEYMGKAAKTYLDSNDAYGLIQSYGNAIDLLYLTGKAARLPELLSNMKGACEKSKDLIDRASSYLRMGRSVSFISKDYDAALSLVDESQKLYSQAKDDRGVIKCLMTKGFILRTKGKYHDSIDTLRSALRLRETLSPFNERDDRQFFHFYSQGEIYRQMGYANCAQTLMSDAQESFEQALKCDEGPSLVYDRIQDRYGLIIASLFIYDFDRAEEEIKKALKEIPTLEKPSQRAVSYNMIVTSMMFSSRSSGLGDYNQLKSIRDSVSYGLFRKIYQDPALVRQITDGYKEWIEYEREKKDLLSEGMARIFFGFFYQSGGKNSEARDSYEKALEIFKSCRVPLWEGLGRLYLSLLLVDENKIEEAKKVREEELKIYESAGMLDSAVHVLNFLGLLTSKSDGPGKSLIYYEKALQYAEKLKDPNLKLSILMDMGHTNYKAKRYDESLKCYRGAMEIVTHSESNIKVAISYFFTGRNLVMLGRGGEAAPHFRKALEMFRSMGNVIYEKDAALELGSILEGQGKEDEALDVYLKALNNLCEVNERIAHLRSSPDQAEDSSTPGLFEKAVSLLIKKGRYSEALKYFEMSGSYTMLESLDFSAICPQDKALRELVAKMKELSLKAEMIKRDMEKNADEKRKNLLTDVLASTRQEFFALLNEIRSRNPDYEKLLAIQGAELAELQRVMPEDTLLLEYYPAPDALYIFVVSKEAFSIRKVEVARERLYAIIGELREALIRSDGQSASYRKNRALLYGFLLAPVRDEIKKKNEIEIIPAGLLWYVPLEILGDDNAPALIEEKNVGYLYSSDILRLLAGRKESDMSSLLAFGNPAGANLPLTEKEVESIGGIFPDSRVYTGAAATRERLFKEAPRCAILHIASHSSLNREDINKSYIQFGDAPLTLGEVYGLQMPGASLVVLSSCESAIGEDNPGREFASLASAFTIAGASSVIASLWKVEDSSTALLFDEFYRNLKSGHTKAEALRQAKLALMKNPATSHPFYWAGFILLGDWR